MKNINAFAKSRKTRLKIGSTGIADLRKASVPRSMYGNKRDSGMVLVIGGSNGYYGAPVLAARAVHNTIAALRTGAGYAVLCVPKEIEEAAVRLSPNIIVRAFANDDVKELERQIERADSIAIGMGMGREPANLKMIAGLISHGLKMHKKMVIDADAIYAIRLIKKKLDKNVILTPHTNEFFELSRQRLKEQDLKGRVNAAARISRKLNANLLLKGHNTVITNGRQVKVNRAKTPALATMGTGDVLSGIIAGYAATGCDAFEAGAAGAFLQGRIGDILSGQKGNHIIATDVIENIPKVLKKFDKKKG